MKKALFILGAVLFLPQVVFAQAQTYTAPGAHTFTVPSYSTMTVEVWGGGGGGGSGGWSSQDDATNGAESRFNSSTPLVGNGGVRGRESSYCCAGNGPGGNGGTYSGGASGSENGEDGHDAGEVWRQSGAGGDAGGPGGDGAPNVGPGQITGLPGTAPGGGASGGSRGFSNDGGGGGGGGYAKKTFTFGEAGAPAVGANIAITVGAGGLGGEDEGVIYSRDGGDGARGEVRITWTTDGLPTCTLSLSPTTINSGGSSTLTWSSTNATSFSITNVGAVSVPPGAGSTLVSPSSNTTYAGTVTNGVGQTATCSATLTVAAAVTADLVGNGEGDDAVTITEGAIIPFSWSSSNATGCTLVGTPWSGSTTGTSGPSRNVTFPTQGIYDYTLTCTGGGGATGTDTVRVTVNYSSCPITNGTGAMIGGVCTVQSCDSGYHQEGNSCVANTRSCAVANGTGIETWNGSSWGACVPASCNSGYEISGATCIASLPSISSFYGDRVRKNTASTLRWNISTITGLTCSISPDPTDGNGIYSVGSANGTVTTIPVTQSARYTLSCTNGVGTTAVTATVNLLPAFQEI